MKRTDGKFFLALTIARGILLGASALALAACSSSQERAQSYYDHGMKLMAEHDNARASIEFRNAIKLNKNLLGAWQALAQIEETNKNWGGVIANLRNVVELDPNDLRDRIKLGRLLLVAGSVEEALKLVNDANPAAVHDVDLLVLKAALLFRLNDSDGAVREAKAALEVDHANVGAKMVLAGDRLAHSDPKAALAILDTAASDTKPDQDSELGVQLFRIRVFEQMGDVDGVQGVLRKLITLYPQEVNFQRLLLKSYVDQNKTDEAEKMLRSIATTHPTDTTVWLDLIRFIYTVKKNPVQARQELLSRINAGGEIFGYQLALAEMDFTEGKFPDGVQVLEGLIKEPSSTAEQVSTARADLAQKYLSRKNIDAAQKLVADLLGKDARNINGLRLRAAIRIEQGQLDSAVTDLRQALNDQPQATDLMLMLAGAYERQGSIELAEKQFADAMRASNYSAPVGLAYVAFLQRRGGGPRVEDVLTELATHQPNNVQILSALAQAKLARQDWTGAQELAESIRKITKEGGLADQILGASLSGQNKFEQSIQVFQNAYAAAPTAVQPMYALVRALVAAKQPDRAISFLKSVLQASPSNADALALLGSVQMAANQPSEAERNLKAAMEKQPKNPVGYVALAGLYSSQRKDKEALKVLRTGLSEQPDSPALQLALASALDRTGDFEGAISEYQRMLGNQSANLIVINNLASLLSEYRADKASLDEAQRLAVGLKKSAVPQFKDTLGWISYREGDIKDAMSALEDVVASAPNLAAARYHLGMSYIAAGQADKASEQLKKALDLSADAKLSEQARAALKGLGG